MIILININKLVKLSLGIKDNYKTVLRTEIFGMRESISRFNINKSRTKKREKKNKKKQKKKKMKFN